MWLEYLRIALSVLRGHKFRSFLTVGSITIGAFSIVLMTSLADGGLKTLMAGMAEVGGAELLAVWSRAPNEMEERRVSYSGGLTRHDFAALRGIPHLTDQTVIADFSRREVRTETGHSALVDIVAADARFVPFFRYRLAAGRAYDEEDVRRHAHVCLVGDAAAKHLGEGDELIGRSLLLLGTRCQVIGRLAPVDRWGIGFGWEWDDVIALPFDTARDAQQKEVLGGMWALTRVDDTKNNEIAKRVLNATLRERHHGVNDFQILDFHKGFFESFMQIMRIMQMIVGLLAGIALLVGGVGVMNIMLVSVSERVREIGIRKALGASERDIGRQFLIEAVALSGLGGVVGAALGVSGALAGAVVIRLFKPRWITAISEPAVLAALLVTLLIGVLFGYFPARRAGKLDAVVAIRSGG